MIQIKITIKNDHAKITHNLERKELLLIEGCPDLKDAIEKMIEDFKGSDPETPVAEVIIKTKMEI